EEGVLLGIEEVAPLHVERRDEAGIARIEAVGKADEGLEVRGGLDEVHPHGGVAPRLLRAALVGGWGCFRGDGLLGELGHGRPPRAPGPGLIRRRRRAAASCERGWPAPRACRFAR